MANKKNGPGDGTSRVNPAAPRQEAPAPGWVGLTFALLKVRGRWRWP